MKTKFKEIFYETLSLDIAKAYSKDWDRDFYNHWFGHNVYRLYFDENSSKYLEFSTPSSTKIELELKRNGYEIENWEAGLAKKKGDKNLIKIGKVLQKINPELKKDYDLMRDKTSKLLDRNDDKLMVVISRHPYDIAGMSTDRDWQNCMELDLSTGEPETKYGNSIIKYIKNNALIAYLIKSDDKNIKNPLGRILIYPYFNDKGEIYLKSSIRSYGKITKNMVKIIDNWLNEKQKNKTGVFKSVNMVLDSNPGTVYSDEKSILELLNQKGISIKYDNNLSKLVLLHKWFFNEIFEGNTSVKNAKIELKQNKFIWKDGIWNFGTWENGIWEKGTFGGYWKGGTWKDGIFDGGIWENGVWEKGTWKRGYWYKGTWKGGIWITGKDNDDKIKTEPPNKW